MWPFKKKPKNIGPEELERRILSYQGYGGGATISPNSDSAMRVMTVHSCATAIANAYKQLPGKLKQKQDGIRRDAEEHYLWELLTTRPNSWMTPSEFDGMLAAHYSLRGNFICIKSKYKGQTRELLPVHPDRVGEIKQNPDYSLTYKIQFPEPMGVKDIRGEDIFHVRALTLDGVSGLNRVAYARQSYEYALALESHGATTMKNGAFPSAALETDAVFENPEEAEQVLKEFDEMHGGPYGRKLMLLTDGLKFKPISMNYPDMQFLDNRKFQKKEIVGLMFGIPIDLMSSGDTTTFASAQEFNQSFLTFTMAPLVVSVEEAVGRDIIGRSDLKNGYYYKKNLNALLRSDPDKQMAAFKDGINTEIYNPNEVRELLDMNPYEGGDEYRTRTSTTKSTGGASETPVQK